jgi:hypothetical protein
LAFGVLFRGRSLRNCFSRNSCFRVVKFPQHLEPYFWFSAFFFSTWVQIEKRFTTVLRETKRRGRFLSFNQIAYSFFHCTVTFPLLTSGKTATIYCYKKNF